jgi:hypothetical protein
LINKSRLASYAKHAKVTQVKIEIIIYHDYKIVNVIHNPHINHNSILMSTFRVREQASPIYECVTVIQINSHLTR